MRDGGIDKVIAGNSIAEAANWGNPGVASEQHPRTIALPKLLFELSHLLAQESPKEPRHGFTH